MQNLEEERDIVEDLNKNKEVKAQYESRKTKDFQMKYKELEQVDMNTEAYNLPSKVTQIPPLIRYKIHEVS